MQILHKGRFVKRCNMVLTSSYELIDIWEISTQQFKGRVSGVKVKSVDTTGAGDAFTGAILFCLASDVNVFKVAAIAYYALIILFHCGFAYCYTYHP